LTTMTEAERELLALVIGHTVRVFRMRAGLLQEDLAFGVGSQSTVSLVESGRQLPMPDVLRTFAEKLQSDSLRAYAEMLETNQLSLPDILANNEDTLHAALKTHRGKWHEVHAKVAVQLCQHYYYAEDYEKVQMICQMIMNHKTDGPVYAQACFYLGSTKLFENDNEDAEKWLLMAELHGEETDNAFKAKLFYNLGYVNTQLDIQVLAMWYAKKAVDEFHKLNDFERHGKSLALLGVIQSRLGRFVEAKSTLTMAHEIMHKWGATAHDVGRIQISLADVYVCLKDFDTAVICCNRALESAQASNDLVCVATAYRELSFIHWTLGDPADARKMLKESVRHAEMTKDVWSLARSYLLATSVYETHAEKVLAAQLSYDHTRNTNNHVLHALSAEALANLHTVAKENELAAFYRDRALDSYREYVSKNSMFSTFSTRIQNHPA